MTGIIKRNIFNIRADGLLPLDLSETFEKRDAMPNGVLKIATKTGQVEGHVV